MIALAIADGPLAHQLLTQGELAIDYLETTGPYVDTTVTLFPKQPLLLHNSVWNWSLGHPDALAKDVLALTRRRLEQTKAPWLSIHLGFSAAEVTFADGMKPASITLSREQLLVNIVRNVRIIADSLSIPLLLENLDYNPGGAYEHICQPDFIGEVLTQSGAWFLLDVAHARVSAARLGCPITDYLNRLPLDRVRQLHISGPRPQEGTLTDAHEPLQEEDYRLLREILARAEPWALTLEYHREASALEAQLRQLREILRDN